MNWYDYRNQYLFTLSMDDSSPDLNDEKWGKDFVITIMLTVVYMIHKRNIPENSMAAFLKAVENGYGIELRLCN